MDLSFTNFLGFEIINNLGRLQELWLDGYQGGDWETLGGISSAGDIRLLSLTSSTIMDTSILESFVSLQKLNLDETGIEDIGILESLRNLTYLSLLHINAKDLSPLVNLDLQELYIDQDLYDSDRITVEKLNEKGCQVSTSTN